MSGRERSAGARVLRAHGQKYHRYVEVYYGQRGDEELGKRRL